MSGTRRPNFIEHLGTQNRATEPARIQEHSRRRQIILAELCKEFHPKWKLEATSVPIWDTLWAVYGATPLPASAALGQRNWYRTTDHSPPPKQGRIAAALASILRLGSLPVISHALACLARQ